MVPQITIHDIQANPKIRVWLKKQISDRARVRGDRIKRLEYREKADERRRAAKEA